MGVIDVVPGFTGYGGNQSSPDGREFNETRTVPYTVLMASPTDSISSIYAHPDVPKVGSSMFGLPWFRCVDRALRKVSPVLYELTVSYQAQSKEGETPLDMLPRLSRRTIWSDEPIDIDADGKPIRTINRESYEGITERYPIFVYEVRRNVEGFNDVLWRSFSNAVNSEPWGPFGPGEVLLFDFNAEEVVTDEYVYFAIRAEFHTKEPPLGATPEQTWYKRILHQGYYINVLGSPPNQLVEHAKDKEGNPVTKPVLLDEQGKETKTPYWVYVKTKKSKPFASLGII